MMTYIESESLRHHSEMVGTAMDAYAAKQHKNSKETDKWWAAGLLHDLDWEKYPDEHPNKAVNEILPGHGYSENILNAIRAHAPERTGKEPERAIERYIFACDELAGFMNAVALMKPNKFEDMKVENL